MISLTHSWPANIAVCQPNLDVIRSRSFEHDGIDNETKRKVKYKILHVKLIYIFIDFKCTYNLNDIIIPFNFEQYFII